MNRKLLATAILAGLCATGTAYAQTTPATPQDQNTTASSTQSTTPKKKKKETLQAITVTGSLIPQSQIETATPVITITAQDLLQQGFKNVYQALHSLPVANGAVQGNTFTQGFTPGLQTVSLLGLPPSFTLVLLNGKPISDYPVPYNSNATAVDFTTIPTAMVDRIEIVPGNQSAIYGSSAIAGVINIILKQHFSGTDIDYRAGGYTDGGGQQQRLDITSGKTIGKWSLMGSISLVKQNPIFAFQRSYTDSTLDDPNPAGRVPFFSREMRNAFGNPNVPPPSCDGSLFKGTNALYSNAQNNGAYCGSYNMLSQGTLLNGEKQDSFYGKADYQLNDNTDLYASLLYNLTKIQYLTGGYYSTFWEPGVGMPGYVYDLDSKQLVTGFHIFAPEEVGDLTNSTAINHSYVFDAGIKGTFGNSNWNYDAYVHRSDYKSSQSLLRPLTDEVNAWFTGPQDGVGPYGYGYPAYHLEQNGHFWGTTTPAELRAFSAYVKSNSESYNQQGAVTVTNTDLFTLPWDTGSVGFAGQLTRGNQLYNNPVDPRIQSGEFWGLTGTSVYGKRGFESGAFEFDVPVFKMLTVDLAGRYDKYMPDGGASQGKFTYKVGFEFRPIDSLLLRANYGTAFRAPGMPEVFTKGTSSYENGIRDTYNCRISSSGNDLAACAAPYNDVNNVITRSNGNPDLKYITATSWGYGVVWSPTQQLTLKSDYYHVKIANEVNQYADQTILDREADCRIGETIQGNPVDGTSPSCQQFISEVGRAPLNSPIPGIVQSVYAPYINISKESVSGIQTSGSYKWSWGRFGDFDLGLDYAVQTSHLKTDFPGDQPTDLLRTNSYGNQFKDIGTADLSWNIGKWTTTVLYERYGKTFSVNGQFTVGPWMVYNATLQYHVTPDITATLIGNNIFNARPPVDPSATKFPYFDQFSYNPYGRLVMLELDVHLH